MNEMSLCVLCQERPATRVIEPELNTRLPLCEECWQEMQRRVTAAVNALPPGEFERQLEQQYPHLMRAWREAKAEE